MNTRWLITTNFHKVFHDINHELFSLLLNVLLACVHMSAAVAHATAAILLLLVWRRLRLMVNTSYALFFLLSSRRWFFLSFFHFLQHLFGAVMRCECVFVVRWWRRLSTSTIWISFFFFFFSFPSLLCHCSRLMCRMCLGIYILWHLSNGFGETATTRVRERAIEQERDRVSVQNSPVNSFRHLENEYTCIIWH